MIRHSAFFELFMMVNRFLVTALVPTQRGRLLQDFAFGGAGGELTFVAWQESGAGSPEPLCVLFQEKRRIKGQPHLLCPSLFR
ncbi:hypothetical protein B1B05_10685 [Domibacillus enclensis]|uniref:Secreted protein n=1 Tax=Domibacillus enclensis TaxID=1017273 RepID=A0ABX4E8K7_9BACI|nr:hypothetical protein B1B05_10685 [Domibacillus enclensis]